MKKILFGYLLMLGIIPSTYFTGIFVYLLYARVLGAILLYFGLREITDKSPHFLEIRDLTLLLAIVQFLLVTVGVINASLISSLLITLLRVLIDIVFFFVTYKLILGAKDIETQHSQHTLADKVLLAFLYMIVLYLAQLIFSFEPLHTAVSIGYTLCKLFFIYRVLNAWQHYKASIPNSSV